MNIGLAIRSIRSRRSIAQFALAEKCGISQTTLSQIENGRKRPGPKTLESICRVLEVPPAIIYLMAMEKEDVPESKRAVYSLVFPSIKGLALQMIESEHREYTREHAE